ncbi:SDR family oxidoreductase [Streptomyces sp. NPDC051976]|uniref:SDR family oxidoreductase n=1 Tax=Streptomyces sp. NPDC051976 TaxID=3154947 RepID=UPI00342F7F62
MAIPTDRSAIWFVTGTSHGVGLGLVKQLLERGDCVAATTRSSVRLLAALGDRVDTSRLCPLTVDLRNETQVKQAVQETVERFDDLDVVVNNAGYGFLAAIEKTSARDVRDMLDVQVVGVWNVLRAALPVLHTQRSGHVVNVSSVLGLTAVPAWGLYCAGKFALEGLSEALAAEVADFGIDVTIVEPGCFRTGFLSQSSLAVPADATEQYPGIRQMVDNYLKLQGNQLADPLVGAAAIIDRVVAGKSPLRQVLGSDSHAYATAKVRALLANLAATAGTAPATDFPAA